MAEVQWAWEFPWYSDGVERLMKMVRLRCTGNHGKIGDTGIRTRLAFKADIPPVGYRVYTVRKTDALGGTIAIASITSPFALQVYEDKGRYMVL